MEFEIKVFNDPNNWTCNGVSFSNLSNTVLGGSGITWECTNTVSYPILVGDTNRFDFTPYLKNDGTLTDETINFSMWMYLDAGSLATTYIDLGNNANEGLFYRTTLGTPVTTVSNWSKYEFTSFSRNASTVVTDINTIKIRPNTYNTAVTSNEIGYDYFHINANFSLPSLTNQTPATMTFNQVAKYADSEPIFRLKMKRRYISGGVDAYDADWTTITSYVLNGGLGDVEYGVDDQEWISGVTKIGSLDLMLDNSERKFNDRSDSETSFWADSTTSYYIANSAIELEMGYQLPTGTQYYPANPYHSGYILNDSIKYGTNDNTFKCTVASKLSALSKIFISEFYNYTRSSGASGMSLVDTLYDHLSTNYSYLELTTVANFPAHDIFFDNVSAFDSTDAFTFCQDMARNSGSLFGINRKNEVFLTYFNNEYYQNTNTTFPNSSCVAYYLFSATTIGDDVKDLSGNSNDLSVTGTYFSLTTGKFGQGRYIYPPIDGVVGSGNSIGESPNSAINTTTALSLRDSTLDLLVRFPKFYAPGIEFTNIYYGYAVFIGSATTQFMCSIGFDDNTKGLTINNYGTYKPEYRQPLFLGENQWGYFSFVNDYTNNILRAYLNGTKIASTTAVNFTGNPNLTFQTNYRMLDIEIDSARITDFVATEDNIKNNTARIFGNKFQWESNSTYNFYNYGKDKNIIDLLNYDNGLTKLYNEINFANSNKDFICEFQMVTSATASDSTITMYFANSFKAGNVNSDADIKSFFNDNYDNCYCTITSSGVNTSTFKTVFKNVDLSIMPKSYLKFTTGANPTQTFTSSNIDYLGYNVGLDRIFSFLKQYNDNDFITQNTSSIYEYGKRSFLLDTDFSSDNFEYAQNLSNQLLTQYSTPKVRMKISTRFLEGDLDLFDRVTVNWKADQAGRSMGWDDGIWDDDRWGIDAGGIIWSTKDFWIIGVNHSFSKQESIYTLREV